MISSVRAIRSVFIIAFALQCAAALGNSSPNVPIDDHVYQDIDKLVSAGLIKDAIYGQRPWSRTEIARMIAQARRQLMENNKRRLKEKRTIAFYGRDRVVTRMASGILMDLEKEYHDELIEKKSVRLHLLEEASLDSMRLDSPFRAVPENNGLAGIRASINPLISYREGRHYADGATVGLESVHWGRVSKYFSF
jgi:hypothetical protein